MIRKGLVFLFPFSNRKRNIFYLPSVQDHVAEKPPDLTAFVWPVDENGIDGHWTGRVNLTHYHRIISKEAQL
jgi:hypothetical protein